MSTDRPYTRHPPDPSPDPDSGKGVGLLRSSAMASKVTFEGAKREVPDPLSSRMEGTHGFAFLPEVRKYCRKDQHFLALPREIFISRGIILGIILCKILVNSFLF